MGSLACVSGLLVPSSAEAVVGLASPFVRWPWCGLPAPWFCLSFPRLLVVFFAPFFVCLARPGFVLVSLSLARPLSCCDPLETPPSCPFPACFVFALVLLPGFPRLFPAFSSFSSLLFSSVSRVLLFSYFLRHSVLLSRAEPRSFVSLLVLLGLTFFSLPFSSRVGV